MAPQKSDPDIPELYQEGRDWRLVELIVASVILLVVIGFLVWYFFFRGTPVPTPPAKAPSTSQHTGNGNTGSTGGTQSGGSASGSTTLPGNNGGTGSSTQGATGNSTGPSASTNTNGSLTNTGPGDVIAIFLGATALGAVVYRLKLRRSASLNR